MSDEAELAGGAPGGVGASLRPDPPSAIIRTLRRLLRNDLLAKDALQATYVTAIERIDRFDPAQGCMDAWLAGIARHKAQESHRESRPRYDARGAAGPLSEPESGLDMFNNGLYTSGVFFPVAVYGCSSRFAFR
jgi:hypothetical protein